MRPRRSVAAEAATNSRSHRIPSSTASARGRRSTTSAPRSAAAWAEAVIAHEIAARGFLAGETGPWIEAERALLQGTQVQALQAIAEAELALGRLDDAERAARRLVALEPLRESGYRLLMRSLAAAGDRAAAAAVMEECRASLARAGAVPTAETERAFSEVIRGRA